MGFLLPPPFLSSPPPSTVHPLPRGKASAPPTAKDTLSTLSLPFSRRGPSPSAGERVFSAFPSVPPRPIHSNTKSEKGGGEVQASVSPSPRGLAPAAAPSPPQPRLRSPAASKQPVPGLQQVSFPGVFFAIAGSSSSHLRFNPDVQRRLTQETPPS